MTGVSKAKIGQKLPKNTKYYLQCNISTTITFFKIFLFFFSEKEHLNIMISKEKIGHRNQQVE